MSDKEYIKQVEKANESLIYRSERAEDALEKYMAEMTFLKNKLANNVQKTIDKTIKNINIASSKIVPLKDSHQEPKNITVSYEMYKNLLSVIESSLKELDKAIDEVVKDSK